MADEEKTYGQAAAEGKLGERVGQDLPVVGTLSKALTVNASPPPVATSQGLQVSPPVQTQALPQKNPAEAAADAARATGAQAQQEAIDRAKRLNQ
jgi:hypothetical protein